MSEKKSKSPYQRYRKAPYLYSTAYYAWREALLRGDKAATERLGRAHWEYVNRMYG